MQQQQSIAFMEKSSLPSFDYACLQAITLRPYLGAWIIQCNTAEAPSKEGGVLMVMHTSRLTVPEVVNSVCLTSTEINLLRCWNFQAFWCIPRIIFNSCSSRNGSQSMRVLPCLEFVISQAKDEMMVNTLSSLMGFCRRTVRCAEIQWLSLQLEQTAAAFTVM